MNNMSTLLRIMVYLSGLTVMGYSLWLASYTDNAETITILTIIIILSAVLLVGYTVINHLFRPNGN